MHRIAYETPQFREDFRRASRQAQGKIEAFIRKFDEDTERDGMRLKTPQGAVDPRVKTARVDQGLRAVLVNLGQGDHALVRVMEHDSAYKWAGSLRPDVSAFNGLPRLIHLPEDAEPVRENAPTAQVDLFAHRRDRDFRDLGVPDFAVPLLRNAPDARSVNAFAEHLANSDPLIGIAILGLLESKSVDELFAELLELEGGPDPDAPRTDGVWNGILDDVVEGPEVDTSDLHTAVQRPGAGERFRIVDDSEELIAALQGDFADWQIFLHPLQRDAAYAPAFSGSARVSGGAGTGKTVVLLHRVKALLDRAPAGDPPRILVTTYTSHLQRDLVALLTQLVGTRAAELVEVQTVDGLARHLHDQMTGEDVRLLSHEQELALWHELVDSAGCGRSAAFLRSEYRHVVLAHGVRTLSEYLAVSRAGRGVRLGASERRALWPVVEAFEARTRQVGLCTTLQLTENVAALLSRFPASLYDHVLVDEAQDLHAAQWRLLRAIVEPGRDDLFLVGDAFQRIYGDTVSLRSVGIETRGRSRRLRRNYRTTHEIVGWALGIIGDETAIDLDELGADLRGYHSVRGGPVPRFLSYPDRRSELAGIVVMVREWINAGYDPGRVAVATRSAGDLQEIVTALQRAHIAAGQLGRRGRLDTCVNVATMHRLKGLEYPCVAVTGLDADRVPDPDAICPAEDDIGQHKADLQTERSLIYVAATRARDELAVTWSGEPTSLLRDRLHTLAAGSSEPHTATAT